MTPSLRILLVSAFETPFIRRDIDFLRSRYEVRSLIGAGVPQAMRVVGGARNIDVVFAWFASTYGALAVLQGRRSGARTIIQVGGVDVAKDEATGYGLWTSPWRGWIVGHALRRADKVLVVDESLKDEVILRARYDGANIEVLPTGYSSDEWKPDGPKHPFVLTVASVPDRQRVHVKGIDLLFEAAKACPETSFEVLGVNPAALVGLSIPANVRCSGYAPQSVVAARMRSASVYCQPSRREGLSNALCEAMLSGCVPVATDVGGSRKTVGATGYVVPPGDTRSLAEAIRSALESPDAQRSSARARIIELFDEKKRQERLCAVIEARPSVL